MPLDSPVSRRKALVIGVIASGTAVAGCSNSSGRPRSSASGDPTHSSATASASGESAEDAALRARAVADERRLLAACAAPAGAQPFAALAQAHRAHLKALTGILPPPLVAALAAPAAAPLARAEQQAAAARRSDCTKASPQLAPLLASLAAGGGIAAALLGA